MLRTVVNVTGDTLVASIVDKYENVGISSSNS